MLVFAHIFNTILSQATAKLEPSVTLTPQHNAPEAW